MPPGSARVAGDGDRDLLIRWPEEFGREDEAAGRDDATRGRRGSSGSARSNLREGALASENPDGRGVLPVADWLAGRS